MTTLASLIVGLGIDTKDYDSGLKRVEDSSRGFGNTLKNIMGGIGAIAITGIAATGAVVGAGLGLAVSEAMEAQEIMAQIDATLKSTGAFATVMVGGMTDEAIKQVEKLKFNIADKTEAILSLGQSYADKRALIESSLGNDLTEISVYTAERMSQAIEGHMGKVADLYKRMSGVQEDYEYEKGEREEDLNKTITRMDEDHADSRLKLVRDLERATTDEQKARTKERIDDMDQEYDRKRKRKIEDAEERELDEKHEKETRIQALIDSLDKENLEHAKQTKWIKDEGDKRIIEVKAQADQELIIAENKYNGELDKLKAFISEAKAEIGNLSTEAIPISIIRPTKELIMSLAEGLSKVTRYSDDAILGAEEMLLTFTSVGRDVFPEALSAVLDMSTVMKTDLVESAKQLGKALGDPITGLTALRKNGVMFSEGQEDMIKSMMETGDIAGAQAVILKELQTEFGGSAEAAGTTLGGQLDILKNKMLEVAETVGTSLLPVLTTGLETITPYVDNFGKTLTDFVTSDKFKGWIDDVVAWLRDDLPVAIGKAKTFWNETLMPAFQNAQKWMKEDLIPTLKEIKGWFDELPAGTLESAIKLALFGVVAFKVYGFVKDLSIALEGLKLLFGGVGLKAGAAAIGLNPISLALAGLLIQLGLFKVGWDNDWFRIQETVETAKTTISGIIDAWFLLMSGDPEGAKATWLATWDTLMGEVIIRVGMGLDKLPQTIKDKIRGTIERMNELKTEFDWVKLGKDIVQGIIDGLTSMKQAAIDAITGIGISLKDAFNNIITAHSPSVMFRDLVREGIGGGMGLGFGDIATSMPSLMKPLTPALANISATPGARGGGIGGSNFTLEWHDHSMFRLADRYEMERVLGPTIEAKFRELLAKGKRQ